MDGATRIDSTTDDRPTTDVEERTDGTDAESARDSRPLIRHGSDLLDLVAGGVPFAVAHDVRASSPRPAQPSDD